MNTKTKKELENLMTELQKLSHGLILTVGMQTATDIVVAAENVKEALRSDETIVEVS